MLSGALSSFFSVLGMSDCIFSIEVSTPETARRDSRGEPLTRLGTESEAVTRPTESIVSPPRDISMSRTERPKTGCQRSAPTVRSAFRYCFAYSDILARAKALSESIL